MENKTVSLNISSLTLIKIIAILLLFYVLFLVKEILAVLFVALIFASAIDPWVDWMQERKIPRALGVIFIYLLVIAVVVSAIALIIPPIVEQVVELSNNFPYIVDKIISGINVLKSFFSEFGLLDEIEKSLDKVGESLQGAVGGVFSTVAGIFGSIFSFFLVLVITFYMVVEENAIKKIVWSVSPPKYQVYIMGLINRMQKKIGLWLRGQMILSFILFSLIFFGLKILGVKYALTLAFVAGLTEFVPYLGPVIAAIPAIFLSFTQSPMLAVFVTILYYIIQLVENNIIVPKLMQKVVGLNPVISITVLLIGFNLAGIPGAILSIPVATAVKVFLGDLVDNKIKSEEIGS